MMDVYKTLDNSGLDKLKKSYTSVIKLEKELGRMSISQLTKSVQNSGEQISTASVLNLSSQLGCI